LTLAATTLGLGNYRSEAETVRMGLLRLLFGREKQSATFEARMD
jgi:hypothetical protein